MVNFFLENENQEIMNDNYPELFEALNNYRYKNINENVFSFFDNNGVEKIIFTDKYNFAYNPYTKEGAKDIVENYDIFVIYEVFDSTSFFDLSCLFYSLLNYN